MARNCPLPKISMAAAKPTMRKRNFRLEATIQRINMPLRAPLVPQALRTCRLWCARELASLPTRVPWTRVLLVAKPGLGPEQLCRAGDNHFRASIGARGENRLVALDALDLNGLTY